MSDKKIITIYVIVCLPDSSKENQKNSKPKIEYTIAETGPYKLFPQENNLQIWINEPLTINVGSKVNQLKIKVSGTYSKEVKHKFTNQKETFCFVKISKIKDKEIAPYFLTGLFYSLVEKQTSYLQFMSFSEGIKQLEAKYFPKKKNFSDLQFCINSFFEQKLPENTILENNHPQQTNQFTENQTNQAIFSSRELIGFLFLFNYCKEVCAKKCSIYVDYLKNNKSQIVDIMDITNQFINEYNLYDKDFRIFFAELFRSLINFNHSFIILFPCYYNLFGDKKKWINLHQFSPNIIFDLIKFFFSSIQAMRKEKFLDLFTDFFGKEYQYQSQIIELLFENLQLPTENPENILTNIIKYKLQSYILFPIQNYNLANLKNWFDFHTKFYEKIHKSIKEIVQKLNQSQKPTEPTSANAQELYDAESLQNVVSEGITSNVHLQSFWKNQSAKSLVEMIKNSNIFSNIQKESRFLIIGVLQQLQKRIEEITHAESTEDDQNATVQDSIIKLKISSLDLWDQFFADRFPRNPETKFIDRLQLISQEQKKEFILLFNFFQGIVNQKSPNVVDRKISFYNQIKMFINQITEYSQQNFSEISYKDFLLLRKLSDFYLKVSIPNREQFIQNIEKCAHFKQIKNIFEQLNNKNAWKPLHSKLKKLVKSLSNDAKLSEFQSQATNFKIDFALLSEISKFKKSRIFTTFFWQPKLKAKINPVQKEENDLSQFNTIFGPVAQDARKFCDLLKSQNIPLKEITEKFRFLTNKPIIAKELKILFKISDEEQKKNEDSTNYNYELKTNALYVSSLIIKTQKFLEKYDKIEPWILRFLGAFNYENENYQYFSNENWLKNQKIKNVSSLNPLLEEVQKMPKLTDFSQKHFLDALPYFITIFNELQNDQKMQQFFESNYYSNSLYLSFNGLKQRMRKYVFTLKFESFRQLINRLEDAETNDRIHILTQFSLENLSSCAPEVYLQLLGGHDTIESRVITNLESIFGESVVTFVFDYSPKLEQIFSCQNETLTQSFPFTCFEEIHQYFHEAEDNLAKMLFSDSVGKDYHANFDQIFSHLEKIYQICSGLKKSFHFEPKSNFQSVLSYAPMITFKDFMDQLEAISVNLAQKLANWQRDLESVYSTYFSICLFSEEQLFSIFEQLCIKREEYERNTIFLIFSHLNSQITKEIFNKFLDSLSFPDIVQVDLPKFAQALDKLISLKDSNSISVITEKKAKKWKETLKKYKELFERTNKNSPPVFLYKLDKETDAYEISTSLYFGYCGKFPVKENLLFCNPQTTTIPDINRFFNLYRIYNTSQKNENFRSLFTVFHLHKLSSECLSLFIKNVKEIKPNFSFPLLIFYFGNDPNSSISTPLSEFLISKPIKPLVVEKTRKIFSKKSNPYDNIETFTSHLPGMGKSYQIQKKYFEKKEDMIYSRIVLYQGTPAEINEKINEFYIKNLQNRKKIYFLHIELPLFPQLQTLDFLWTLSMCNYIETKRQISEVFIWPFDLKYHFAFEIPSDPSIDSESQLNRFPGLKFFRTNKCVLDNFLSFNTFAFDSNSEMTEVKHPETEKTAKLFMLMEKDYKNLDLDKFDKEESYLNTNLDPANFFIFLKEKFSQRIPSQFLTFRTLSNVISLLQYHHKILKNLFLSVDDVKNIFYNLEKTKEFIRLVVDTCFDSLSKLSLGILHLKLEKSSNEVKDFEDLLQFRNTKITWGSKLFSFCVSFSTFSDDQRKVKSVIISNSDTLSTFNNKLKDYSSYSNFISILELIDKSFNEKILQDTPDIFNSLNPNPIQFKDKDFHSQFVTNFLKKSPVFNSEILVKIMYIQFKLLANIPIIFMSENFYYMIHLFHFLFRDILKQSLLVLFVTSETQQDEIVQLIQQAEQKLAVNSQQKINILFHNFDVATQKCLILFKEILLDNCLYGRSLSKNINFLACLNSFSVENINGEKRKKEKDDIDYSRKNIHHFFLDNVCDFGEYHQYTEPNIIALMIHQNLSSFFKTWGIDEKKIIDKIKDIIVVSREFMNRQGNIKHRTFQDVKNFLRIFLWSSQNTLFQKANKNTKLVSKIKSSIFISLFVVYASRYPKDQRDDFYKHVSEKLQNQDENDENNENNENNEIGIEKYKQIEKQIESINQNLINDLGITIPENIVLNEIIKENIIIIFVSWMSRIPLLLMGKPGTSKSTSLQILLNLFKYTKQENRSKEFKLPVIESFEIPCSQYVNTNYIPDLFQKIKNQAIQKTQSMIPLVILKEFTKLTQKGLFILESEIRKLDEQLNINLNPDQSIPALILISNSPSTPGFYQDFPGIVVNREALNKKQLEEFAQEILSKISSGKNQDLPSIFVGMFQKICESANRKEFILHKIDCNKKDQEITNELYQNLDFFYFCKSIHSQLPKISKLTSEIFFQAFFRNFGDMGKILSTLQENYQLPILENIKEFDLDKQFLSNIKQADSPLTSRYSMLFVEDISFFSMIYYKFSQNSMIISGSNINPKDSFQKERELIKKLSIVQKCVSEGKLLVVVDDQSIYPLLNNVFAQYHYSENDEIFTTLFFRNELIKVKVDPNFRLIVVTSKAFDYELKDPNVISRFEKNFMKMFFPFLGNEKKVGLINELFISIPKISKNKITQEKLVFGYRDNMIKSLLYKYEKNEKRAEKKIVQFCKISKIKELERIITSSKSKYEQDAKKIIDKFKSFRPKNFDEFLGSKVTKKKKSRLIVFTTSQEFEKDFTEENWIHHRIISQKFPSQHNLEHKITQEILSKTRGNNNLILSIHFQKKRD